MKLVELRSAEADFREAPRSPLALLPTGAVEQHSRHLPLGTDVLIAELIATTVEERLREDVVLLPAIAVGASDHHLQMPGTASVGTFTMAESISRQFLSLAASSGISRFLILNGHGGNQPAVRLALELLHAAAPGLEGYGVDYWALMLDELDASGIDRPSAMGHADIIETSILLAKRPDIVRLDLAEPDDYRDGLPPSVSSTRGIPERTDFGGVGDSRQASSEMGDVFFEAAVAATSRLVDQISSA